VEEAAMATTVAFAAFSASSLNSIFMAENRKLAMDNPGMKKSNIGGKQYLDYL